MTDQLIPINIIIGDRSYRIKSLPKDEEVIRRTLKTINDKIVDFKTQFAGKDMQDYIAMVLIWYATQLQDQDGAPSIDGEALELLATMKQSLDAVT